MPTAIKAHCSVAYDNKVYTFGGFDSSYNILDLVQVYNISSNTWSTVAPMLNPASYSGATVLGDKIYVIGGQDDGGNLNIVQIFDPVSETWNLGTNLPETCVQPAVNTYNSKLYIYFSGKTYEGISELVPPPEGVTIRGTVYDAVTFQLINGAEVNVNGDSTITGLNGNGKYEINNLTSDHIEINVSNPGYLDETQVLPYSITKFVDFNNDWPESSYYTAWHICDGPSQNIKLYLAPEDATVIDTGFRPISDGFHFSNKPPGFCAGIVLVQRELDKSTLQLRDSSCLRQMQNPPSAGLFYQVF